MKNTAQKNMVLLAASALVLVALNTSVWVAAQKGSIGPVENMPLWSAFVALNVVTIIWAVTQLGLQPLVIAASYVGGGFLAFNGARGLAGVSVAELTTAGATYGAFGALAVGNATMKVRLAFFSQKQVPFIFIIAGLLLVDAVLNSRVSQAGWSVILTALILPFIVAGCMLGVAWMVVSQKITGREAASATQTESTVEAVREEVVAVEQAPEQLTIKVPARVEEPVEQERIAATVEEVESSEPETVEEPVFAAMEADIDDESDDFFPLEIDKNEDDFVLPQTDSGLVEIATMVVEDTTEEPRVQAEVVSQPPVMEPEAVIPSHEETTDLAAEATAEIPAVEPEVHVEAEAPVVEEKPAAAEDSTAAKSDSKPADKAEEVGSEAWLSGHLDLLNKIK